MLHTLTQLSGGMASKKKEQHLACARVDGDVLFRLALQALPIVQAQQDHLQGIQNLIAQPCDCLPSPLLPPRRARCSQRGAGRDVCRASTHTLFQARRCPGKGGLCTRTAPGAPRTFLPAKHVQCVNSSSEKSAPVCSATPAMLCAACTPICRACSPVPASQARRAANPASWCMLSRG